MPSQRLWAAMGAAVGAKPGQALGRQPPTKHQLKPHATSYVSAAINMFANEQRALAQIPFIVKCFLPHTSNGCSGGPLAEPAADSLATSTTPCSALPQPRKEHVQYKWCIRVSKPGVTLNLKHGLQHKHLRHT